MNEQFQATREILVSMRQAAEGVSGIGASLDDWAVGMEERRSEYRPRVLLPARIVVPGTAGLACTIRDLMEADARVHAPDRKQVSSRFGLIMEASERRYDREVRHRSGPTINVRFTTSNGMGSILAA